MSVHAAARRIATEQGWSTTTLLDVVLDYIDNQQADAAFIEYLGERAAADNRESGAMVARRVVTADILAVAFNKGERR